MDSILLHKSREEKINVNLYPAISRGFSQVDFDGVSSLEFVSRISLKSLLWALAFFIFFIDLCIRRDPDNWFFSSLAALAAGFAILSILLADRQHFIVFCRKDGTKTKLSIAKDNKKEAEQFVNYVNKQL